MFTRAESAVGEDRVEQVLTFIAERFGGMEEGPDEEVPELGMSPSEYADDAMEVFSSEAHEAYADAARAYVGASPTDFHVPVLYIYGELTGDVIAGKADRLERAPTDVRVEEIDGASHALMLQRPDAFSDALRTFLADVNNRPSTADD